jgi:hypothetical protein
MAKRKRTKGQSWNLEVLTPNTWNKTQSCKRNAVINWWNSGLSHIYGKEKSIIYNKRKKTHLNPKEKTKWAYKLLGTSGFFKLIVTKASCSISADFLDQCCPPDDVVSKDLWWPLHMLITDLFYNYFSILLVYVLINLNVIKLENVISSFQLVYLLGCSKTGAGGNHCLLVTVK